MRFLISNLMLLMAIGLACLSINAWADTFTVPDDYGTIQTAVSAAEMLTPGPDTIVVKNGVYEENVEVYENIEVVSFVNHKPVIIGEVSLRSNTTLRGMTVKTDVPYLSVACAVRISDSAADVTIKNCVLDALDAGLSIGENCSDILIESASIHSDVGPYILSEGSSFDLRNSALTLEDSALSVIEGDIGAAVLEYNCIVGMLNQSIAHKGTIFASPGYADAANGDFSLAMASEELRSPSVALDAGHPQLAYDNEIQLTKPNDFFVNRAIDIGSYGNTQHSIIIAKKGDADIDGDIDPDDLAKITLNWSPTGIDKTWLQGDYDLDGDVDPDDLAKTTLNWDPLGYLDELQ